MFIILLFISFLVNSSFGVITNYVTFGNKELIRSFDNYDLFVPSNIEHDNNVQILDAKKFKIVSNRHGDTSIASSFSNGITSYCSDHLCGTNNKPSKLNFFVKGTLRYGDGVFSDFRIGQGHHGSTNNWHVGATKCNLLNFYGFFLACDSDDGKYQLVITSSRSDKFNVQFRSPSTPSKHVPYHRLEYDALYDANMDSNNFPQKVFRRPLAKLLKVDLENDDIGCLIEKSIAYDTCVNSVKEEEDVIKYLDEIDNCAPLLEQCSKSCETDFCGGRSWCLGISNKCFFITDRTVLHAEKYDNGYNFNFKFNLTKHLAYIDGESFIAFNGYGFDDKGRIDPRRVVSNGYDVADAEIALYTEARRDLISESLFSNFIALKEPVTNNVPFEPHTESASEFFYNYPIKSVRRYFDVKYNPTWRVKFEKKISGTHFRTESILTPRVYEDDTYFYIRKVNTSDYLVCDTSQCSFSSSKQKFSLSHDKTRIHSVSGQQIFHDGSDFKLAPTGQLPVHLTSESIIKLYSSDLRLCTSSILSSICLEGSLAIEASRDTTSPQILGNATHNVHCSVLNGACTLEEGTVDTVFVFRRDFKEKIENVTRGYVEVFLKTPGFWKMLGYASTLKHPFTTLSVNFTKDETWTSENTKFIELDGVQTHSELKFKDGYVVPSSYLDLEPIVEKKSVVFPTSSTNLVFVENECPSGFYIHHIEPFNIGNTRDGTDVSFRVGCVKPEHPFNFVHDNQTKIQCQNGEYIYKLSTQGTFGCGTFTSSLLESHVGPDVVVTQKIKWGHKGINVDTWRGTPIQRVSPNNEMWVHDRKCYTRLDSASYRLDRNNHIVYEGGQIGGATCRDENAYVTYAQCLQNDCSKGFNFTCQTSIGCRMGHEQFVSKYCKGNQAIVGLFCNGTDHNAPCSQIFSMCANIVFDPSFNPSDKKDKDSNSVSTIATIALVVTSLFAFSLLVVIVGICYKGTITTSDALQYSDEM